MFKKLFNNILGNNEQPNAGGTSQNTVPQQQQDTNDDDDDDDDDDGYEDERELDLDETTLHGKHYTVAQFDAEVKKCTDVWIKSEEADGEKLSQQDIDNIHFEYAKNLYIEWNGASANQLMQWQMANTMKYSGFAASGFVKEDENNPLLTPIHGLSLKDYGGMVFKLSGGVNEKEVCAAMGIEPAIFEEVNTLWVKRMQEDSSFTVTTLYGQYFMEGDSHPKLMHLQASQSTEGAGNLEKLKTDRYFYEELCGARNAAYSYGLDGAQWIQNNFGINLGDFQAVAMQWMTAQNQEFNAELITHYLNYQEEKQEEYAAKFAAEQGGNIADDVDF